MAKIYAKVKEYSHINISCLVKYNLVSVFNFCRYANFNDVCQKIWQEDRNRVSLGRDYRVNIQNRIYDASSNIDRAYSRLFSYVDRNILTRPTFKTFLGMFLLYFLSMHCANKLKI